MKICRKFGVALLVVSVFAGFYVWMLYGFYGAFENLRYRGDAKRIPLWYPFELVNDGNGVGGVQLLDCRTPCSSSVVTGDVSAERLALSCLCDIVEFGHAERVLWGRRELWNFREYLGERYFVLTADDASPAYFTERDAYAAACRAHRVDPGDVDVFEERWKGFWSRRGTPTVADVVTWWFDRWFTGSGGHPE